MINEDEELALGYLLDPAFELTNTAGKPLTDGWINVYVHGTRNKYYCYSDWNGNLHPFNIPLDGLGANIVLASPQFTYDVYVYNKYGTLQMSRYNVSPVGVGDVSVSGINEITSSDGTVEVSQYGDTFDLSVPDITAVSGLVEDLAELTATVTGIAEDVSELTATVTGIAEDVSGLTSAVSGLTEDVEDLNTAVSSIQEDIENISSAVSAIQIDYVTEEELTSAISAVSAMVPAAQVQSDWDENDPSSKAYILNKPDMDNYVTEGELASAVSAVSAMIPEAQVQSDWDEDDPSSKAYILNKPEEKDLVAGDGIEITVSGTSVIISADIPSVTGYVTEQELASVSGTLQLEIDTVSSNPRVKTVEYGVDEWSDVVAAMNGVSAGQYDYVVMKYSANGTDIYAPLVKYEAGSAAYFVSPAQGTGNTYGYGERRTTEVFTINSGDLWLDRTIRPFQGKLIGAGNVSVSVQGEDYIVSGGSFVQVNADWNAVSGVAEILNKPTIPAAQVNSDWEAASGIAEILNKPETIEIETVGVSAGSGISIAETASGIVISCTVTGGPGASYTAGSGIDITNNVIAAKVDGTTIGIDASGCLVSNKKYVDLTYNSSTWAEFTAAYTKLQNGEIDGIRAVYGGFYADYVFSQKGMWGDLTNAVFTAPAYTTGTPTDYNTRRYTRIFTLTSGGTWSYEDSYAFEGKIIGGTNVTVTASGSDYIVSSTGGGSSYTAGDNIDITNDVISVTGTGELIAGTNITIAPSGSDFVISAQGGGSTYTAGSGIDITNDTISVDNTVALKTDIVDYTAGDHISVSGDVIAVTGISELVPGDNITITASGVSAIISASGGGVTYTAGSGIDITNDTISLDDPVSLVEGSNISISVTGASAIISSDAIAASQIASAVVVSALPANPVSGVLYLIPEA